MRNNGGSEGNIERDWELIKYFNHFYIWVFELFCHFFFFNICGNDHFSVSPMIH